MASQLQILKRNLVNLESELNRLGYWADEPPLACAFLSTQPFCCDTLRLEQWLQFVFIPRMNQLIAHELPLPTEIAICPMAEHVFSAEITNHLQLITILGNIDETLSGQRHQTVFLT